MTEPQHPSNVGAPFQAKYLGKCPRCLTLFDRGTFVVRIPDEEVTIGSPGKYAHADPNECTSLDAIEGKPTKFEGSTLEDMGF